MAMRYQVGDTLRQIATLLQIDPARVLRRAGLSEILLDQAEISVDAAAFFDIWDATLAEAGRDDAVMTLAMAYAHGPFVPPIFAFSCSETLALGLARVADFKPLLGPFEMKVTRPDGALRVELHALETERAIPPSMSLFEALYITECARTFTGTPIAPVSASLTGPVGVSEACLEILGNDPKVTGAMSLEFSREDAERPLITRSKSLWESLEHGLRDQLRQRVDGATLSGRIRKALSEALPGGSTSVDDMARRLNVSKRSLQRRLTEEGTSFQEILNETRFEMSERYLKESGLSVPEISYLLGFRETSSFFRAFQSWTGTTPGAYRSGLGNVEPGQLH